MVNNYGRKEDNLQDWNTENKHLAQESFMREWEQLIMGEDQILSRSKGDKVSLEVLLRSPRTTPYNEIGHLGSSRVF